MTGRIRDSVDICQVRPAGKNHYIMTKETLQIVPLPKMKLQEVSSDFVMILRCSKIENDIMLTTVYKATGILLLIPNRRILLQQVPRIQFSNILRNCVVYIYSFTKMA